MASAPEVEAEHHGDSVEMNSAMAAVTGTETGTMAAIDAMTETGVTTGTDTTTAIDTNC